MCINAPLQDPRSSSETILLRPMRSAPSLLRSLATVSGMTLLSRILGFVRDFVIARSFGAGLMTDAFFVAFKLPNLLRRLFAEGAFSQAFVPLLAEYRNRRGEARHETTGRPGPRHSCSVSSWSLPFSASSVPRC